MAVAIVVAIGAALAVSTCHSKQGERVGPYPVVLGEDAPAGATDSGGDKVLKFGNFVRVQVPEGEGFASTEEFFEEGWPVPIPVTRWTLRGPDRAMVLVDNSGVGNGELRIDGHVIKGNQFRIDREWIVNVLEGSSRAPQLDALKDL